jgi:STE24 endopeptidase
MLTFRSPLKKCQKQTHTHIYITNSTKPTIIGLMLFLSTLWAPVDKMLSFVLTLNTRRNEFQADQYSVNLNYGPLLKMGLVKMSIENRSTLDPDPLYSLYHYSHPPLIQRLSAIDDGMKKKS